MSENSQATQKVSAKEKINALTHKLFGSTPGDGEMQPKEGFSYSLCGFGQNLICTIIGSYLTVFMTDAIGFNALAVAFLMLGARIFDALNDPIMGSIVDRTRTKWGKCRPYMKWMAFPIAIMTAICFLPWYPQSDGGFAAISVMYVVWGMIYTVADVPYWGLSTAMSNDTYRRGNLLTIARLFCTAGAGIVTVITPIITDNMTKGLDPVAKGEMLKWIYFVIAIVCCVIAVPLFFLGFKNTTERNISTENPPSLGHNLKLLFKNKPLMLIVLSGIGGAARMLFTYTGGLYFAKYIMDKESMYSLFTMAIVPGGLIASLLVPWCTKKFGKRNTYIWSHIVGGVAMLIAFIVGIACDRGAYTSTATTVVLLIALVIAGIPSGFGNIVTYAMIGDTVEYLELKTGERAEGICFAMQTLINKIGMAVGAFVGVLAYYMAGVAANDASSVTPEGKDTMWFMLVGIAAISFFLTVIPLFFYKFNEKQQQEAKAEIEARKHAKAEQSSEELIDEIAREASENVIEEEGAAQTIFPNEDNQAVAIEQKTCDENCEDCDKKEDCDKDEE
ncbi:na+/xyloside symporter related transporter [Firmicutes bacterium CAG:475]|nr:na+/xyloside symporter related transporter [Firmicutes bacterium CAG:475]